jgi:hypothetical protein
MMEAAERKSSRFWRNDQTRPVQKNLPFLNGRTLILSPEAGDMIPVGLSLAGLLLDQLFDAFGQLVAGYVPVAEDHVLVQQSESRGGQGEVVGGHSRGGTQFGG